MAQDFAKNKKKPSSKPGKKKPAGAATRNAQQDSKHWSWFFSGLFSGVLLCVIGYIALNQLNPELTATDDAIANTGAESEENESGTDLEFYDYLPQAEVEVSVVPVEVASNTIDNETNPTTYILQAASFQDPNDAEELRAKLILLNLETRIEPTPINGATWYRVQAGPFVGRRAMDAAETILIENNINPIRMRIPNQ